MQIIEHMTNLHIIRRVISNIICSIDVFMEHGTI